MVLAKRSIGVCDCSNGISYIGLAVRETVLSPQDDGRRNEVILREYVAIPSSELYGNNTRSFEDRVVEVYDSRGKSNKNTNLVVGSGHFVGTHFFETK